MPYNSPGSKYTSESSIIKKIKNGDKQIKDKFIKNYVPLIVEVILSFNRNKFIDIKDSNEYSVGLIAFDEAIRKFDDSESSGFTDFAQMIIRTRMMDYFRNISEGSSISFQETISDNEAEEANMYYNEEESKKYDLINELESFSYELRKFGLNIQKLPEYMPENFFSKQVCISVAKKIVENKDVYDRLVANRYLSMMELSEIFDVHPQIIERNRNFIISVCIIFGNDYENFKAYLSNN